MDTKSVLEIVGQMIRRNLTPLIEDDREAKRAFDRYVLAVASKRFMADLSPAQLTVLQSCDRREHDKMPPEICTALGFGKGRTYRDALSLCAQSGIVTKHRIQEELAAEAEKPKETEEKMAKQDRRQDERRRSERR